MKVLVLAERSECGGLLDRLRGIDEGVVFIDGQDARSVPGDPSGVDAIVGPGACAPGHADNGSILGWRTHPHTYLVPCWFPVHRKSIEKFCLWPALSIDRFDAQGDSKSFSEWLSEVAQWQQNRMNFGDRGAIKDHGGLELATALCLRRATGVLSVFDDDGGEGEFFMRDGNLIAASFKHLREVEAFYELLCMNGGGYVWNSRNLPPGTDPRPVSQLIPAGLKTIGEANFLYNFASGPEQFIRNTDSRSALDDSAAEHFSEQQEIYGLVEKGVSISQLIEASPLSRPSTMKLLAKWFSLEDITIDRGPLAGVRQEAVRVPEQHSGPECSVLIVDDSPLLCKVLRNIFDNDPRMKVAGVANDGLEALRLIGERKPDVVTMDLEMPGMDGITALKHILIRDPRPVVVLSAFTEATSRLTYESFKYGAVEVIQKPPDAAAQLDGNLNREFCDRIARASRVRLNAVRYIRRRQKTGAGAARPQAGREAKLPRKVVIVVCGAGGFPSFLRLILAMPGAQRLPLTVIGMDMPGRVTRALIANMKKDAPVPVETIPRSGPLRPGVCYVVSNEDRYRLLEDRNRVIVEPNIAHRAGNGFFDELLASAADSLKSRLVAVSLSGAGDDGVEGMRLVGQSGGGVFALAPGVCLRPELSEKVIGLGCAEEIKDIGRLSELFDLWSEPDSAIS